MATSRIACRDVAAQHGASDATRRDPAEIPAARTRRRDRGRLRLRHADLDGARGDARDRSHRDCERRRGDRRCRRGRPKARVDRRGDGVAGKVHARKDGGKRHFIAADDLEAEVTGQLRESRHAARVRPGEGFPRPVWHLCRAIRGRSG